MNISRYLSEGLIELDFKAELEPPPEDSASEKWRARNKERILAGLVDILQNSGRTGNNCKLLTDFINRERKASTAIGHGIAVPHIRSMQAKELIIGFARSPEGLDFDSIDGEPTHLFFVMAAPPYDDSLYLKVFKALSENLQYEAFRRELMEAQAPYDVIRAFKNVE
ncbi:MAG: PTS sugar transporter subunit IIA [Candidatus Zixiibacteriota bacterium]|nr:MAG: PTS sugar transporter subunit IIA [candidate division Zixibacteria bacterium]